MGKTKRRKTKPSTMSALSSLSEMVFSSTIYKRHEIRNNSHQTNAPGVNQPLHPPHQPIDGSVTETLMQLPGRNTIYHTHNVHHQEMKHDPHAGEQHMVPSMVHHHNGLFETFAHMSNESSIYDRNFRRSQYLHE